MPTDTPFRVHPIVFPAQLLAKATIRLGATNSAATTMNVITQVGARNAYIIRLLEEAPSSIQFAVKDVALASNSEGQKQLGCLLALFLMLSPEQKVNFIDAYKAASTIVGQGAIETYQNNSWQGGTLPPHYVP